MNTRANFLLGLIYLGFFSPPYLVAVAVAYLWAPIPAAVFGFVTFVIHAGIVLVLTEPAN